MRVVHLVEEIWPRRVGGVELFVHQLSEALGPQSRILSFRDAIPGAAELPRWPRTQLFKYRHPRIDLDADVIHIHQFLPWGVPWLLAQAAHTPTVLTLHDWFYDCQRVHRFVNGELCSGSGLVKCARCTSSWRSFPLAFSYQALRRLLMNMVSAKVTLAVTQAETMDKVPAASAVLPYAVSPQRQEQLNKYLIRGGGNLLYLGHDGPHKGFANMVSDLQTAGFGTNQDKLYAFGRISNQNLPPFAIVAPEFMSEKAPMSVAALLLPSLWLETGPLVVLEALGAGLPVIARAGSLTREMAALDGVYTYSSPEELKSTLKKVMTHVPEFRLDYHSRFLDCVTSHQRLYASVLQSAKLA